MDDDEELVDDPDYVECEYCRRRATRHRRQEGVGDWYYCDAHAPEDAGPFPPGGQEPLDESR